MSDQDYLTRVLAVLDAASAEFREALMHVREEEEQTALQAKIDECEALALETNTRLAALPDRPVFTVVGVYENDFQPFASSYEVDTAQAAVEEATKGEDGENNGLIVAGVFAGSIQAIL